MLIERGQVVLPSVPDRPVHHRAYTVLDVEAARARAARDVTDLFAEDADLQARALRRLGLAAAPSRDDHDLMTAVSVRALALALLERLAVLTGPADAAALAGRLGVSVEIVEAFCAPFAALEDDAGNSGASPNGPTAAATAIAPGALTAASAPDA